MSEPKLKATHTIAWCLARLVEPVAYNHGGHVALTGGCLFKDGKRKDIDLLFYRIRQVPEIDETGLLKDLEELGFTIGERYGWVVKSTWEGYNVDLFFPESKNNHLFPLKEGWNHYHDAGDLI